MLKKFNWKVVLITFLGVVFSVFFQFPKYDIIISLLPWIAVFIYWNNDYYYKAPYFLGYMFVSKMLSTFLGTLITLYPFKNIEMLVFISWLYMIIHSLIYGFVYNFFRDMSYRKNNVL